MGNVDRHVECALRAVVAFDVTVNVPRDLNSSCLLLLGRLNTIACCAERKELYEYPISQSIRIK